MQRHAHAAAVAARGQQLALRKAAAASPRLAAALERGRAAAVNRPQFWRELWLRQLSAAEENAVAELAEWALSCAVDDEWVAGGVSLRGAAGVVNPGLRADRARFAVDPEDAFPHLSAMMDTAAALQVPFQHDCQWAAPCMHSHHLMSHLVVWSYCVGLVQRTFCAVLGRTRELLSWQQ